MYVQDSSKSSRSIFTLAVPIQTRLQVAPLGTGTNVMLWQSKRSPPWMALTLTNWTPRNLSWRWSKQLLRLASLDSGSAILATKIGAWLWEAEEWPQWCSTPTAGLVWLRVKRTMGDGLPRGMYIRYGVFGKPSMSQSMTGWMIWYMVEIGWTPVASLRRSIVFWLDAMARSDGIPIGMLTMWSPECMQSSTSLYFFTFYVELYKSWPSGLLQDFTLVFWQCLSWVFTEWTNCIDRSDLPVWWKPAWMLTNSMVHVWMYRMTIGGWDTDVSPRKHALWELAVEGSDMSVAVVWFACLGCTCKEQLFETCLLDGFEIYNKERILWEAKDFIKMKMEKRKRKK